ncbi:AI-2E family transporter [Blautia argi]|uniref:AI-2E family transporter n=1 Tax=Blautia argi TaxID=1912897 RepID=A0A2Z4UEF5_9FIRM|nr:AI-2E family transporter [Blautia argi]AWY99184.1 AI-2E family transporter [Blautia argi]
MEFNKKNMKNMMFLIVFAVLFYVGVQRIENLAAGFVFVGRIVFPFILGGAMAFILNLPMSFLEKRLFGKVKKRKLVRLASLVLSILFVLVVVQIVLLVVIPEVGTTVASISNNIEALLPELQKWAVSTFPDSEEISLWIQSLEFNWDKIIQTAIDFLKNGAGNVLNSTFTVAKTVINSLMNFCVAFVFACYILLQKEKLSVQVKKVLYAFVPVKFVKKTLKVASLSYKTFANFVTGQCLEAVILGTMFFIAMSLLKFPYALLVGVVIAFTALIPIFGAFIGCVLGTFLIFVSNPMQAIGFVILFLMLQQIEGNLIYPHVVGGSVGLPSIWVLVAVTVGGSLMGVVGMLIFIPLSSVVYALFREMVYKRLKERGIHDI